MRAPKTFFSVRFSAMLLTAAAALTGCADGPATIAGGWLQCDPSVDDVCSETLDVGFYFPPDGGPLLELHKRTDGTYRCAVSPLYYVSNWVEQEDGSILVDNVPIFLSVVLERDEDLLQTAFDGTLYDYPGEWMTKVVGPGVCAE